MLMWGRGDRYQYSVSCTGTVRSSRVLLHGSFKLPGFWAGHPRRLTLVSGNLPPTESRLRVPSILLLLALLSAGLPSYKDWLRNRESCLVHILAGIDSSSSSSSLSRHTPFLDPRLAASVHPPDVVTPESALHLPSYAF